MQRFIILYCCRTTALGLFSHHHTSTRWGDLEYSRNERVADLFRDDDRGRLDVRAGLFDLLALLVL